MKSALKALKQKDFYDSLVPIHIKNVTSVGTNLDTGYFFWGHILVPFLPDQRRGLLNRLSKLFCILEFLHTELISLLQ